MIKAVANRKIIQLSSIHKVDVLEGSFKRSKPMPEEDFKIILSRKADKNSAIIFLLNSYMRDGDFSAVKLNELTKTTLEALFKECVAYVVEEKFKSCLFTYLDIGTAFYVMKVLLGPLELQNKIVKFARPEKNFEKDAAPGYKTAKDYFGSRASVLMTLADLNIRATDSEGIERIVFLPNALAQERVIVLKNILSIMTQKKDVLEDQFKIKGLDPKRIPDVPEIKKIGEGRGKIIHDFQKLYGKEIKGRGFEDKDEGEQAMDRNYGYRIPPGFTPSDWGYNDYLRLKINMSEMQVVGFDFDSVRQLKEVFLKKDKIEIKKDRVPDVFSTDIKVAWKDILERILVKRV